MAKKWSELSDKKKQDIKDAGGSKSAYKKTKKAGGDVSTRNIVGAITGGAKGSIAPKPAPTPAPRPTVTQAQSQSSGGGSSSSSRSSAPAQDNSAQYQHEASMQQQAHENSMLAMEAANAHAMAMQNAVLQEEREAREFQAKQTAKDRATSYMNANQKKGQQFQGNDFTGGASEMGQRFGGNTYQPRGDMMREFNFAQR